MFFSKFCKIIKITHLFLKKTSDGCFWNILFTWTYEAQIKSNSRKPFWKSFHKPFKTIHKNEIKETSDKTKFSPFFETHSYWTSIFKYFKLRMQAFMIFLNGIVEVCSSSCCRFKTTQVSWKFSGIW